MCDDLLSQQWRIDSSVIVNQQVKKLNIYLFNIIGRLLNIYLFIYYYNWNIIIFIVKIRIKRSNKANNTYTHTHT